ncbi:MAG TPA: sigma 54-interacting transcriptional regulator [Pyrinomonadaceae bacterium]
MPAKTIVQNPHSPKRSRTFKRECISGAERASAFSALSVTIDRITSVRDDKTIETTLNQNLSDLRSNLRGQITGITLTLSCTNPIASDTNARFQSLLTLAARHWISNSNEEQTTEVSEMIGTSPQMHELTLEISRAARSNHSVLLKGESGTGKTTAATMIHEQSARSTGPFVDINCAALPDALLESELFGYEKGAFTGAGTNKKGLFEVAAGGTLFLDEIAEMTPALQAKLLTAIEQKKIRRLGSTRDIQCDVRIIAASSRNIQTMIREGKFREELYYRIAVLEIQIMPLRERPSDIAAIIKSRLRHEQELINRETPFLIDEAALTALSLYDWPGNIRQLQNIVSRLTARVNDNEAITQADVYSQLPYEIPLDQGALFLPAAARVIQPNEDLFTYIARVQLLAIEAATISEGNHTQASKRLGYRRPSLVTLKQKLQSRNYRGGNPETQPTIYPPTERVDSRGMTEHGRNGNYLHAEHSLAHGPS